MEIANVKTRKIKSLKKTAIPDFRAFVFVFKIQEHRFSGYDYKIQNFEKQESGMHVRELGVHYTHAKFRRLLT